MSNLKDKFKDAKVLKQADIAKREGVSIHCCLRPDEPLINGFEHELLIAKYAKLEAKIKRMEDNLITDCEPCPFDVAATTLQEYTYKIEAELSLLKEFARKVIKTLCWGYSLDGCEMQDLAEELGLIESYKATAEDVEEESDFEVGDNIFQFSKILTLPTEKGGQ